FPPPAPTAPEFLRPLATQPDTGAATADRLRHLPTRRGEAAHRLPSRSASRRRAVPPIGQSPQPSPPPRQPSAGRGPPPPAFARDQARRRARSCAIGQNCT